MLKKILIVALMTGVGLNGFSKSELFDSEDAAIEAAKSEVLETVNEKVLLLLQRKLKSNEGKDPDFKNGMDKSAQFLCEKSKVVNLYKDGKEGKNALQLKEVFKKLKSSYQSDLVFSNLRTGKTVIENTDKEVIYTIPVTFDAHTITPSIANNAKYVVTLNYTGKLKKKKGYPTVDGKIEKKADKIIVGYELNKKAVFENSVVVATGLFDSEAAYMKQKAIEKINSWYSGLPANLDAKYEGYVNNNKGIKPVSGNGIKLNQQGKTFTATGNPIEIDFVPEIDSELQHLYTDPIASISITPSFEVVYGDDLKTIVSENIVTGYVDEIKEATTDSEKVSRYESAQSVMDNFSGALSKYVADCNEENRENVKSLFIDSKNDEVAVSHRSKYNNKERIDLRKIDKYLQCLNGNNLTFESIEFIDLHKSNQLNEEYPELGISYDQNLYTIMFDVIQRYDSNNYKDNTRKIVIMNKQNDDVYKIKKIVVVPNSTTINE